MWKKYIYWWEEVIKFELLQCEKNPFAGERN